MEQYSFRVNLWTNCPRANSTNISLELKKIVTIERAAKKICRKCYGRLPLNSSICRKCKNPDLRIKKTKAWKYRIKEDNYHFDKNSKNILIDKRKIKNE